VRDKSRPFIEYAGLNPAYKVNVKINGNVKTMGGHAGPPLRCFDFIYAGFSPAYPMKPKASSKKKEFDFNLLKNLTFLGFV
jgi:hypothetical protein